MLDDRFGPLLINSAEEGAQSLSADTSSRKVRMGCSGVMEDAGGEQIQETGQERRPARMVGKSSLDSSQARMEAGRSEPTSLRQRGEA